MRDTIAAIVEQACAAPTNVFGYGIWTHHITRVVAHSRAMAPHFGADVEITELAALLHDYAGIKDHRLQAAHHVHGRLEAERLLRSHAYPEAGIAAVGEAIAAHRASVHTPRSSPEARCLATADAAAHLEHVPSLLYYAYVRQGMAIDEGAQWVHRKIERSWSKVDPGFRRPLQTQYESALRVLAASTGEHANNQPAFYGA